MGLQRVEEARGSEVGRLIDAGLDLRCINIHNTAEAKGGVQELRTTIPVRPLT